MNKGWWRRNIWGLLLIVPLIAGTFAFGIDEAYKYNYTMLPKEPVPIDGTGRAVLDDYAARLIEVKHVETEAELKRVERFGQDRLPSNVSVWRGILSIEAPEDSFVTLCDSWLVDGQGRRYRNAPSELGGDSRSFAACGPDDEKQPAPYTVTFYFLLPSGVRPTALLITWDPQLPRFIEFPIP